jgi:copper chaperone
MEIIVENIKCGGCMKTIKKAILEIKGTSNVEINLEEEKISLNANEDSRPQIVSKLHKLGYPEKGSNNIIEKAKSYVSCAIGRMSAE